MDLKPIVLLSLIFVFIANGLALGDGGGLPPAPPPRPGSAGAYVKGDFTIAYDKANPNQYTHHNVHAVLKWYRLPGERVRGFHSGKIAPIDLTTLEQRIRRLHPTRVARLGEVHLFSATIVEPNSMNLCKYDDVYLRDKYFELSNILGIPAAFGFTKAHLWQIKVIRKDFCGDLNIQEPNAMLHGVVDILLYNEPSP